MSTSFSVGDRVSVRVAYPPGHVRTPFYIRGKTGVVEGICGEFANPEELAYGRDGLPKQLLYRVRFQQSDIWTDYTGSKNDTLVIEISEHWLESA
ncbi:nitrile hydratase subunit beta [Microcoleus sp. FACHB-SPT15]|uniref:SH3-like domain-containing protein n=1 Tax=Microcoleus sp. FACHB-SPT15 TaxID=2692830 RepID=UPI00177F4790|nr:SH3-like domain-containing protein [Microcoleus sp. FACHB-SPT15]MBD1807877.1 nitrile hydratase subunit beta [Microcoleus sp. FACHB-SPT15]